MRDFEFLEPRTVAEASRMLTDHGETARLLAGGTALLLVMRQRIYTPSHLVWLGGVPGLRDIAVDERNGLRVGAMTSHSAVERHPGVRALYPMIAEMEKRVANPQIRAMATVGGNLCYGDPASDPPACFLALGGSVQVVRGKDERIIPLDDFFTDYYENALAPDEVLTEVRIPPLPPDTVGLYTRFTTTAAESRPLVGVGLRLAADRDRICRTIRLALGAVTPVPVRLRASEDFLVGRRLDAETIGHAAQLAADAIEPTSDFRASAEYRKHVVKVLVQRTIEGGLARLAVQ